jgi:ComEC/Rec2-related protein
MTITHVLAISGQHVAVLTTVIYFALRAFALPTTVRICATLILIWLYILVAGAPPSAIRAGVVATFVLSAWLFGRQVSPLHCTELQRVEGPLLGHGGGGAGGRVALVGAAKLMGWVST